MRNFDKEIFIPAALKKLSLLAARDDQDITLVGISPSTTKARDAQEVLLVAFKNVESTQILAFPMTNQPRFVRKHYNQIEAVTEAIFVRPKVFPVVFVVT